MRLGEWLAQSQDKYGEFSSIFVCGMLIFFTIFVKGIPLVTVVNEQIGGDKYEPSSKAIVLQGTVFVIRSVVKFLTMNYGCALSDFVGRKPIVVLFLLPNLLLDCLLIFGEMNAALLYAVGGLWGLAAISLPTLRAWLCDQMDTPVDTIAAQGAFRGFTIGLGTVLGIPIGTMLVLINAPRWAFVLSLLANVAAIYITFRSDVEDFMSAHHRKERQESARILELMDIDASETSAVEGFSKKVNDSSCDLSNQFDYYEFFKAHSPIAGFQVIMENSVEVSYLWLTLFLSFCANETFIHTLFNYLLIGGNFTPLQASMGFLIAGISYIIAVENMLLVVGGVKANLVGLIITFCISVLVALSSLYAPLATVGGWIFMVLLPFDPSHAGINGMLSRLYEDSRHGEVQGVIEQLATLGVVGGYPGTLMFGYFVSSDAPFYWPGASFACAAIYSSAAAILFYFKIYKNSDGVHIFPRINGANRGAKSPFSGTEEEEEEEEE